MIDPADLIDAIAVETYALGAAFRRHGDALAVPMEQSQAKWQVLRLASNGSLTVPQIARRLGVSRQNVQRIANQLVTEKLAHFSDNPDHKSSPHLMLTTAGRAVLHKLSDSAAEYRRLLARHCRGIDLGALLEEIKALNAALTDIDDGVGRLARATADPPRARRKRGTGS